MDDRTLSLTTSAAHANGARKRILVAGDDQAVLATLQAGLEREGYEFIGLTDGVSVVPTAHRLRPHIVILDAALPGASGFDVCRLLRAEMNVPIIMLTAKPDELESVLALELGADDVLSKPFSMKELIARMRSRLRGAARSNQLNHNGTLAAGDILIDPIQREVRKAGVPLALTTRQFDLLAFLVRNRGRVIARAELLRSIWGYEGSRQTRTVDVHIGQLREKIEDDPDRPVRITTVRGVGYRFT
jgi:DNA-binding response OmpR family regulator